MRQASHFIIGGERPESRLEQLRQQLRNAEDDKERTEELTKEVIRCQHNLTGIRRIFEQPFGKGRIQVVEDVLEERENMRRQAEDWMDDLCPTAWTEESELQTILNKLERIHHVIEDIPHVASKWGRLYADAFYYLHRKGYGDE